VANPEQAKASFLHFYPLEHSLSSDAILTEKATVGTASQADLDDLAGRFADGIFASVMRQEGIHVSFAVLQGYLLAYKEDPGTAADQAKAWAQGLEPKRTENS